MGKMPTRISSDGTPIVTFDSLLEISPFTLFKRLEQGRRMLLVDVRETRAHRTLQGSVIEWDPEWTPPELETEVVLFDDDGSIAVAAARRLQETGYSGVKALFGGLDLYEFALDPQVVGEETYLVRKG
jgi:rhodanese-related sulfurtransferase